MDTLDPGMDLSAQVKPIIVLDGANVCHAYSRATRRGTDADPLGLSIAVNYLSSRGHKCAVVLPRAYESSSGFRDLLINAPITYAPIEDDLFVIQMAMRYDGFILSNDKYRAEVNLVSQSLPEELFRLQKFVNERTITYAFSQEGELFTHPITSAVAQQSERLSLPFLPVAFALPLSSTTATAPTTTTPTIAAPNEDVCMEDNSHATLDPLDATLQCVFSLDFFRSFGRDIDLAKECVKRYGFIIIKRLDEPQSTFSNSSGSGSSHISLPVTSSTDLCQAIVRHAVSEIKNELDVSRLTGKRTSQEHLLSSFTLWTDERKSIFERGISFLFNRQ